MHRFGVSGRPYFIAGAAASRPNAPGAQTYSAQISVYRPASDYTPRIVPYHGNASVPLEANPIYGNDDLYRKRNNWTSLMNRPD
jgi:hypothetical protein